MFINYTLCIDNTNIKFKVGIHMRTFQEEDKIKLLADIIEIQSENENEILNGPWNVRAHFEHWFNTCPHHPFCQSLLIMRECTSTWRCQKTQSVLP